MFLHRFAQPRLFQSIFTHCRFWLWGMIIITGILGLIFSLWLSPPDYQQSEHVRIMYVHVPAAWMGLFIYLILAICGLFRLVWKHPMASIIAQASAPIGAVFTTICLITGSLWGQITWGTWWIWDARLTSMLILLFLYLGHIVLSRGFYNQERCEKTSAYLALLGSLNLPVIKFSVEWWNTLHQPASIFRTQGPSIDSSMLIPLILMAITFQIYYLLIGLYQIKALLAEKKHQNQMIQMSQRKSL